MTANELITILQGLDSEVQVKVDVTWPDQVKDVEIQEYFPGDDVCSPQYIISSKKP